MSATVTCPLDELVLHVADIFIAGGVAAKNGTTQRSTIHYDYFRFSEVHLCGSIAHGMQRRRLSDWGLPPAVVQGYNEKGVDDLYPWQAAALKEGIDGSNLVFSAPTSGGKSLVAEVLMIKRLLAPCDMPTTNVPQVTPRCLFILPYVSIVMEKTEHLKAVLSPLGLRVQGYIGEDRTAVLRPQGESVAVCTMEKANIAVNRLMEEGRLGEIVSLIVDEAHMVGDERRSEKDDVLSNPNPRGGVSLAWGSALEIVLTKILYGSTRCQIIAMSATMSGLETMRSWLKARLFVTNYRPVTLDEHIVRSGKIYKLKPGKRPASQDSQSNFEEAFEEMRRLLPSHDRDQDQLVPLVAEAVHKKESVLVFCQSRKHCESCARMLGEFLPWAMSTVETTETSDREKAEMAAQREDLVRHLQDSIASYPNPLLENLVQSGVGYHHAGMTKQERRFVEDGFRNGRLSVITATTTLAAGVNLPAHRVIVRGSKQGTSELDRGQYLQMVGRAGRAGQTPKGESFIIARSDDSDLVKIQKLLMAPLPSLASCLLPDSLKWSKSLDLDDIDDIVISEEDSTQIQRILLEGIACGCVAGPRDVRRLIISTFVCHQAPYPVIAKFTVIALRSLRAAKLIQWKETPATSNESNTSPSLPGKWELMDRGRAIYASGLALTDALTLYDSLQKARNHMVLDDSCHAIFVVLLHFPFESIFDWLWWQDVLNEMSPSRRRVAEVVGVWREDVNMYKVSAASKSTQLDHARFAAACAIADLIQGGDLHWVVDKWGRTGGLAESGISAGQFQNLQGDVAKWARMGALMCQATDWWAMEEIMNRLSEQATVGSPPQLLDLMRIKEPMTVPRANALFKKGITRVTKLALTRVDEVEKTLASCVPRKKKNPPPGKHTIQIGLTGDPGQNAIVRRAAVSILKKARDLLWEEAKEAEEKVARVLALKSMKEAKSNASEAKSNASEAKLNASEAKLNASEAAQSAELGSHKPKRQKFSLRLL